MITLPLLLAVVVIRVRAICRRVMEDDRFESNRHT